MEEEYKKIDGYDNYQVSNLGNVRNIDTGMILKHIKNRWGYLQVGLSKKWNWKNI